jgi:phosphate transport system protein
MSCEENLRDLKERLLRMGRVCEDMLRRAMLSLKNRDSERARQVFEMERLVNQMHVEVDDRCIALIALRQPVAADLRLIAAAMKINTDLERIGDQAVNVCQTAYYHLFHESPVSEAEMIPRMAEVALTMLRNGLDAFAKNDLELARLVLTQEDVENRLKIRALNNLLDAIGREPAHAKQFVDLILISRNLERIGDHATNIAEDVVFMVLGKDIRHGADLPRPVEAP